MKSQSSILASETPNFPRDLTASRVLSGLEFLLGAFIVIGHNVFHILPNEVIILSLLGLISIRLPDGNWSAIGLKRPASWRNILLIALVAAILRISLGQFLIEPVTGFFWPKPAAPALGRRDHREREDRLTCFVAGVDVCRFWRRDRISRIAPDACGGYDAEISSGLLDRDCAGFDFVWVRTLLQRHIWCD